MLHVLSGLCFALDNGGWNGLLSAHVEVSGVDYAGFDGAALDSYVAAIAAAPKPKGKDQTLAFYMNAYNALTVDLILDHQGKITSIRDLDGGQPWKKRTFVVAGEELTLDHIENGVLRPLGDPRVHAGLNCASKGCPPLLAEAFEAATIDAQLDRAARSWVSHNAFITSKMEDELHISQIFDWYAVDFAAYADDFDVPGVDDPKQEAALNFIRAYSGDHTRKWIESGSYTVHWWEYDWKLNAR
ncbi:MAG TPA: DUF547 domain-containing protein [Myxococcota bacterium]|nr:DUF547 domain-containing protein [Myxococcota bacterium]